MKTDEMTPAVVNGAARLVDVAVDLGKLEELAASTAARALSERTRAAYDSDWRQWLAWCARHDLEPVPVRADDVRLYLVDLARTVSPDGNYRFKASTIERHLASLSRYCFETGGGRGLARDERVSTVMNGIKRERQEPPKRRAALLLDDVTTMISQMSHSTWPNGVAAARDTLALLLGFATAMRRSELAALTNEQVTRVMHDGLHVRVLGSKTDQEGHGDLLAVPFGKNPISCAPCAWVRWIELVRAPSRAAAMRLVLGSGEPHEWKHVCRAGITAPDPRAPLLLAVSKDGSVGSHHLTGAALNAVVKRRLPAGYDPEPYGFHSLRAGFVTQARRNGADMRSVRRQSRHSSDSMVDVYDRELLPLKDNAVTVLGL